MTSKNQTPSVGDLMVRTMSSVEPTSIEWLWKDYFPLGSVSAIVGAPGGGKSFLTADLAAHVSRGADWPDGSPGVEGDVLLVAAEDDPSAVLHARLAACGADMDRVHIVDGIVQMSGPEGVKSGWYTLEDTAALDRALEARPDVRLVVVDPIGSYLGLTDAHRDNEVRTMLAPLIDIARKRRVAIVLVIHTRKDRSGTADDSALGSRAFVALPRVVLHLRPDEENAGRRLLLAGKNNLGRQCPGMAFCIEGEPAKVVWESESIGMTADTYAKQAELQNDPVAKFILDELADGPVPADDIKQRGKAAGMSGATLNRRKTQLGIESRWTGSHWLWLPPGVSRFEPVQDPTP